MDNISSTTGVEFESIHLTLVSVMQAIALETIVSRFKEISGIISLSDPALWMQTIGFILTILWLWFWYSTLAMCFRWKPTMTDVMFPFGIGLAQFAVGGLTGPEGLLPWLGIGGVGYFLGGLVFRNTTNRILRDPRNSEQAYRLASWHARVVYLLVFAVSAVLGAGAILVSCGVLDWRLIWVVVALGNVILLALIVIWALMWHRLVWPISAA